MYCTNPIQVKISRKNNKNELMFFRGSYDEYRNNANNNYDKYSYLPCRKCLSCKLHNAKEWATRTALHIKTNPDNNWFITLTYDDDHLPLNFDGRPTIRSADLTRFLKTLRKHFERTRCRWD